jgi:mono/diheme cytochrome c family protein
MKPKMRIASIVFVSAAALGMSHAGLLAAMEQGKLEPKIAPTETAGAQNPGTKVASSNPLSGDPEAIDLGKQLYFNWCVQCHGPKANGDSPRFGKYAGDLTRFWRGYAEFVNTVKNGRPGKQMPPWKEFMDDDTIAKLGAYLETLAVEGANWK